MDGRIILPALSTDQFSSEFRPRGTSRCRKRSTVNEGKRRRRRKEEKSESERMIRRWPIRGNSLAAKRETDGTPLEETAVEELLTRVQAGVLLYVTELLEPAIAIAAFVRFLAGVDPDVLDELVVAGERLEALLALVRLYLVPGDHPARSNADRAQPRQSARNAAASSPRQCTRRAELPRVHLHRALVHEDLREELPQLVGTLHFCSKHGGWPNRWKFRPLQLPPTAIASLVASFGG